jgi:hypothetical protein
MTRLEIAQNRCAALADALEIALERGNALEDLLLKYEEAIRLLAEEEAAAGEAAGPRLYHY